MYINKMIQFYLFASVLLLLLTPSLASLHQVHSSSLNPAAKETGPLLTISNSGSWTQSLTSFWRYFRRKRPLGQDVTKLSRNVMWNTDCGSSRVTSCAKVEYNHDKTQRKVLTMKEHPLRTDEWEIHYKAGLWKSAAKHEYTLTFDPLYKILRTFLMQRPFITCEQQHRRLAGGMMSRKDKTPSSEEDATAVRFHKNGFCKFSPVAFHSFHFNEGVRTSRSSKCKTEGKSSLRIYPHIGRWKLNNHGCISWDVPISILLENYSTNCSNDSKDVYDSNTLDHKMSIESNIVAFTTLHFVADLHINRFGPRPRMHKGVVTCDRLVPSCLCCYYDEKKKRINGKNKMLSPTLFRPVVGSFVATGVGVDTLDNTYKHRKMGLTN